MKQQMITRVYAPGTDRSAMWANFHGVIYYPTFIVPLKNGIEATYTFNTTKKKKNRDVYSTARSNR